MKDDVKVKSNGEVKELNDKIKVLEKKLKVNSVILARASYASALGMQYDTNRDIYEALGYPLNINYSDYFGKYKRQDIANAVINRPVKTTWRGDLDLSEADDKDTQFEKDWRELNKRLRVKSVFSRADRLTGIGRWGVILMGFDDVKTKEDYAKPVTSGKRKLIYIKPAGESTASIQTSVNDVNSERYGLPEKYQITITEAGTENQTTMLVHYTRVVHICDGSLESEVEGTPRLEAVYNRLMDLEKIVGGDAEMFWRGARPGYHGLLKDDFQLTDEEEEELQDQLDEFQHKLRRYLVTQGIDWKAFEQQFTDPKNHMDIQVQSISAQTGIPKRILTGSERGELSSTQDRDEYYSFIQDRRDEFAGPYIIRPFVERCITYGVISKPSTGDYEIKWSNLFAKSEKELAEIGKIRAGAYKDVTSALRELPDEVIFEFMLGLKREQINLLIEAQNAMVIEEQNNMGNE